MLARIASSLTPAPSPGDAPSRMQGREPLFGCLAAVLVAAAAVLNLVVTTGKGAPAHPSTWNSYAGLLLAIGLVVSIVKFRNRIISPFIAIFAAFFVTLSKGPDSLQVPHIAVLIVAVAFALIVSLHQRRDQRILTPTMSAAQRRAASEARRRRRKGEPEPEPAIKRPPANRRYTPPKDRTKDKPRR